MTLYSWSWLFLAGYIVAMSIFGYLGSRRVGGADDFAVARGGYGPAVLALAFASTAASGATFLGLPGLTYTYGMSTLWIAFLYPLGLYLGVLICQRTIGRYGNLSGARSIPEYLGERYRSEALRISAAVFSLILLFYLAGQLVAGLVVFEMMLGLSQGWALAITTAVLLGYVTLGGAHADILTDGAQGLLMVILALVIVVLFLLGAGSGGFGELLKSLESQDPQLMQPFHPGAAITASVWSFVSLVIAHIPLGLLPHIGNKLWALRDERARTRFLVMAFTFGLILPAITWAGRWPAGCWETACSSMAPVARTPRYRRCFWRYSRRGWQRCWAWGFWRRSCRPPTVWSFRPRKSLQTTSTGGASRHVGTLIGGLGSWTATC